MFSVLTNIYNKKTKGPTVMELFKATGKLKKCFFFLTTKSVRCVCAPRVTWPTSIFKFLPLTRVNVSAFCLHRHPVSVNCLYHARMVLSVGWSFAYFARNARYTVNTQLLVWYSNAQKTSPPERPFSHYIHSHRLAAEMWTVMKNNLLGGKKFELFLLYVQVS